MALLLKPVEPARGWRWITNGFKLFARRPLGFGSLFLLFLFAALFSAMIPLVGGVLQMMTLPLLSLGFMIASHSALAGGPVSPLQFIEPLRGDPARRRSLLILCAAYGMAAACILIFCDWVSAGALDRLQTLMAQPDTPQEEIDAVLAEPGLSWALICGAVLATALSVPFWHAPALVHWGGHGVGQALFSSTLAVWRSKAAFFVYAMAWFGLIVLFGMTIALVFGLLGARQAASFFALPAGLLFSTVFYVSLLFTYSDSFGSEAADGA
jgi:hypothetical protein